MTEAEATQDAPAQDVEMMDFDMDVEHEPMAIDADAGNQEEQGGGGGKKKQQIVCVICEDKPRQGKHRRL